MTVRFHDTSSDFWIYSATAEVVSQQYESNVMI